MIAIVMIAVAFFAGSLPFSVWVGRAFLKKDIRQYGDGNPGTFNVARAGGAKWGALALLLDFLKGAIPVWVARYAFGIDGLPLVLVALAPPLGHAFSPFLRFKGGKAIASIGGVWSGLTLWEAPTVGGLMLGFWYTFLNESAWATLFTVTSLLIYYLLTNPNPVLLAVWVGHFLLLMYKHRAELVRPPSLRGWYRNLELPWHS
jgi:glycerol-3-phosphate acyltransferase PlsY